MIFLGIRYEPLSHVSEAPGLLGFYQFIVRSKNSIPFTEKLHAQPFARQLIRAGKLFHLIM